MFSEITISVPLPPISRSTSEWIAPERSVTTIDVFAFNASGLTNLVIPGSVKHIPENMCFMCENLTSVTLSEGVESIGSGAFMSCKTLTFVSLPATLKSIAGMVFNQDYMLYKVNYKGTSRQWMSVLQDPSWDGVAIFSRYFLKAVIKNKIAFYKFTKTEPSFFDDGSVFAFFPDDRPTCQVDFSHNV